MKSAAALALVFTAACTGFTALSLAMDRHHEDCYGRGRTPDQVRRRALQGVGTLALLVSLWAALASDGQAQGWVLWLGALTAAALVVVAVLSFAPRAARRLLPVAGGVAALLAGLACLL